MHTDRKCNIIGQEKEMFVSGLFQVVSCRVCVSSCDMVISLFKTSSTFIQSVNTVRLTFGFWRKHKFARVSRLCVCRAGFMESSDFWPNRAPQI